MLDAKPGEREWVSWAWVVATAVAIFCTVPVARALQSVVADSVGRAAFLVVACATALAATTLVARSIARRRLPASAWAWLALIVAAFGVEAWALRGNPEEAIHFVEYGLLGVLAYRALAHRLRDAGIYLVAIVVVGTVGILDEWLQWIAPSRYWDLRDLRINLAAGVLTQAAIAFGLRPRLIGGWPGRDSLRLLARTGAVFALLLAASFLNTPERIAAYSAKIPGLGFLRHSTSMMVEYGYRYEDPSIGIFRSRFTLGELAALDARRGAEVAAILDEYINDERYGEFLRRYSVPVDAFVHEAGVHLFRRNRYLEIASTEEELRGRHYNIALREDRLLGKYFPTVMRNSAQAWDAEQRRLVAALADWDEVYESRVSHGLITALGERQVAALFGVVIALLLVAGYFPVRRGRRDQ